MSQKPTYEELKQRIKELRKEAAERKKFEEALKESEERYRSLVDNIDFGVTMIDSSHNIVMTNVSQARMFKKPVHEFIGKKCFREYEKRENICPHCPGVQAMSTGQTAHTETVGIRDDGSRFFVSINAFPILNEEGHPEGFIEIVEDITERKRAEEALKQSEEKYRQLFETMMDAYASVDMKGNILETNSSFNEMLGYTAKEVQSLTYMDLTPEKWHVFESDIIKKQVEVRGYSDIYVKEYIRKNGTAFPVELRTFLIRDKQGNAAGMWAIVRDISDREKLQAQLLQAQKMESIGILAGGIAHDFNNILGIILGNIELAIDDIPTWNPATINLDEVKTASLRAKDVVRQLLSFARKTKLEKKPINIIPIVKESFKLLRSSIPTSIEIRQNIPKNIDTILADPTQINQIIINLCTNADHAMPDGGIIAVTLKNVELDKDAAAQHPELKPGRYVKLTVSDEGHGISQEEIDQIFDPYYTTKEIGRGTGMGLAVVHGLVKEHNGLIEVESEIGKGTTFSIFFPVVEKEAVIETETDDKLPTGDERILFIDDEPALVNLGERILNSLGYDVTTRTSSIEALELFKAQKDGFDLVITDMTMPKMTGENLSKELMKIRPDIPVILCTGFSARIDEKKALDMDIKAFISKPILKREIAKTIRAVLDGLQD